MSIFKNLFSRFKTKTEVPKQEPAAVPEADKHLPRPIDLSAQRAAMRQLKATDTSPRYKPAPMPIPPRMGGHTLRHAIDCPFTPVEGIDIKNSILGPKERRVTLGTDGERIVAFYDAVPIGTIYDQEKAAMMSDWLDRDLPYSGILRSSGDTITLLFYANQNVGRENAAQAVFPLTEYVGAKKQYLIGCMDIGDELTLDPDPNRGDTTVACYDGTPIGTLPQWAAEAVRSKGIQTAYLDKTEQDENFKLIPILRVYF